MLQGLELLVTVLLARNRQAQPTVAAGVPHAKLVAELVSLPSGLLAMVCEAIVKLKVRLGFACVRACVRVGCPGHGRGPTRSRRVRGQGQRSLLEGSGRTRSPSATYVSSRSRMLCRFPMWSGERCRKRTRFLWRSSAVG
jgi:hypothetical protein